ncbi:class I adenylate-forming enzyme family protein [Streptomyces sp. SID14515]|uniref:class I adenylate-forming enzyme family protein n=1 Tax=Streptomyces sp. SID14515 TaxID=2706074 RepID=UPI0013CDC66B|nr:class I adenylate-forming enzyme family protein [Streptomyces sp. SID14515]NEB42426.1 acyl--CoA ligase [Streptomyces sp. SID14515]
MTATPPPSRRPSRPPSGRPASPAAAPRSLPALLDHRAAADPGRTALICGPRTLTFGAWRERAEALAAGLRSRGLGPGARVVLRYGSGDWIAYAVAYCGVLRAGCVAVPLSDRQAPATAAHVLADSGAAAVLRPAGADLPSGLLPRGLWAATTEEIEATGAASPRTEPLAGPDPVALAEPLAEPDPAALAQILYTSGTTGRPKGVTATHGNLAHGCTLDERRRPLRHSRHFLHAFPVGTNAGQTMLVNALDSAATGVVAPQFTPGRFARLIEEYEVGSVFLVPAMAIELLGSAAARRYATDSVRLVGSTAAALPGPVALGLARAFPRAQVVNYYTSTEAAPAQITLLFDPDRPDSPGRPASLRDLRITAPDGTPLPPGEPGEVRLRTPAAPRAYLGEDAARSEVFQGQWVRMGDLGRLDEDGYLQLLDRERDVIKSGAYKVSTLQVEDALHAHPAVADAAAFGVPHAVLGSVVAAVVVPRGELTVPELRTFLLDRLAAHELPARLLFRPFLPRNEGGKILKRELRLLLDDEALR